MKHINDIIGTTNTAKTIKNAAKTISRLKVVYNATQAMAWDNARSKILLLSVASYVALC